MANQLTKNPYCDKHKRRDEIDTEDRIPNRLILCFDGTGNTFLGNPADTNIVKLLTMFNRAAPRQNHYYQPGIGTYTVDGSSVNQSFFGKIKTNISQTIDSGLATSFDAHVIAGYRFLMRYYGAGDPIYIFGFSRGAFTARFVARMIAHVGLLSQGNEEMVPFAYKVYQDYEMGLDKDGKYMHEFRTAFCRHEVAKKPVSAETEEPNNTRAINGSKPVKETATARVEPADDESSMQKSEQTDTGIKVHFLGLFDTVNSVGTFDVPFTKVISLPSVQGTAEHVRHAVSVDERRVKFKAALLAQDKEMPRTVNQTSLPEDHKEVWFPGNHGDIGGGWAPQNEPSEEKPPSLWARIKGVLFKSRAPQKPSTNKDDDYFQLSDFALKWMIDELDKLPADTDHICWDEPQKASFLRRYEAKKHYAVRAKLHDTMRFGGGSSFFMVLFWKMMEYLPFIRRWEYHTSTRSWSYDTLPLNAGHTRDIPPGALFHRCVIERLAAFKDRKKHPYKPMNQVGNWDGGVLWMGEDQGIRGARFVKSKVDGDVDEERQLWEFKCD